MMAKTNKVKVPAKRGQPTKYKPEFIPIVVNLAQRGYTDAEIAETLNVTDRTLRMWKVAHEEFAAALKRSKEVHDEMIEATLIMKANGYERQVQKATASGKVVTVTEYFPPSDRAIQFWLRNRKPELYREQRDVNVKHNVAQGFLNFLERLDAKAKLEREIGDLPPLLLEPHVEDAVVIDEDPTGGDV